MDENKLDKRLELWLYIFLLAVLTFTMVLLTVAIENQLTGCQKLGQLIGRPSYYQALTLSCLIEINPNQWAKLKVPAYRVLTH